MCFCALCALGVREVAVFETCYYWLLSIIVFAWFKWSAPVLSYYHTGVALLSLCPVPCARSRCLCELKYHNLHRACSCRAQRLACRVAYVSTAVEPESTTAHRRRGNTSSCSLFPAVHTLHYFIPWYLVLQCDSPVENHHYK